MNWRKPSGKRAIDVLTTKEAGRERSPDEDQLRFSAGAGRVLYSFNVADFHAIHGAWTRCGAHHAGIILGRQKRYSVAEQLHRLVRLLSALDADATRDRVEFLSAW